MSEYVYTTSSDSSSSSSPTTCVPDPAEETSAVAAQVVEFTFNSTKFMVSPDPDHTHAAKLTMQGQSMAIQVATVVFASTTLVAETQWETPFCGRPPEWKSALMQLVLEHFRPPAVGVEQ